MYKILMIIICISVLFSCGSKNSSNEIASGDKDDNSGQFQPQTSKMPVDWNSVPAEFHPEIYEEEFDVKDISYIKLRVIGITNEVDISMSKSITTIAKLKIYRVWGNSASFGNIEIDNNYDKITVENYTGYQGYSCSKRIVNAKFESVVGGCNVYVELILPATSEIEVSSENKLVSKRYFPISTDQLLEDIDYGFNEERLELIESYIKSYTLTNKKLVLLSSELELILKEFTFTDKYKFLALKKLHIYVKNRESLEEVINNVFSFEHDREEARKMILI